MVCNKIIIDPTTISEDLLARLADEITNPRSLSVLALKGSTTVQVHAVQNFNTPIPLFEVLCDTASWEVRVAIAEQARTPRELLLKLSNDHNFQVRHIARRNLKKLKE